MFQPKLYQIRGGQNCLDTYTPPFADPMAYHDSAHCLRYSDLWYTVYDIDVPKIKKNVLLKVYEKRETETGPVWVDLVNKRSVQIGTTKTKFRGKNIEVEYAYPKNKYYALDPKQMNLLVPEGYEKGPKGKRNYNPEEFLVVPKKMIDLSGRSCDKIGIGYEGFFKQPNRCEKPQGLELPESNFHLFSFVLTSGSEF